MGWRPLLASPFSRRSVLQTLEILALRQQVAVLKRKGPRPPLYPGDRLTSLRRL